MEIRVLHILTGLYSGGVQTVVLNYAQAMRPYHVFFDYVVQKKGDQQLETQCREEGHRIYFLPDAAHRPAAFVTELFTLVRAHPEYYIVHAHQNDLNSILLLGARLAGVKNCISHSHSSRQLPRGVKGWLKRANRSLLSTVASQRWACSCMAYEWLYGKPFNPQAPEERIFHNAIPLQRFQFDPQVRSSVRTQLGVEGTFVCGCVATLSHNKNQEFLLRVLSALPESERKAYRLLLVGAGPISDALKKQVQEDGLEEQVLFLGDRHDVPQLLQAMDCFVLPSLFEGVPLSVLEAQASGLPCLLSDGVPRETDILPGIWHEGVEPENVPVWARKLQEIRTAYGRRESDIQPLFEKAGYDLEREAEKLAQFYKAVSI